MKILDLLCEGISDIVYHHTDLSSFNNIMANDSFYLKPASFSREKTIAQKNGVYFLSTTRNKSSNFEGGGGLTGQVTMVLDGRKLSHNYKGEPVAYFSHKHRTREMGEMDEMEDRILSNSPIIPNATGYITEVHINTQYNSKRLQEVALLVKKQQIPLYMYQSQEDFKLLNKNKAVGLMDILNQSKVELSDDDNEYNTDTKTAMSKSMRRNNQSTTVASKELLLRLLLTPINQYEKLSNSEIDAIQGIITNNKTYEYYMEMLHSWLMDMDMDTTQKLHNIFKAGYTTPAELIKYIYERWESAYREMEDE